MRIRKILAALAIAVMLPLTACGAPGCDDFTGDTSSAVLADDCGEDDD